MQLKKDLRVTNEQLDRQTIINTYIYGLNTHLVSQLENVKLIIVKIK